MSDKIARLGIERDNDKMYYIKNGDVWAVPRKQKGQPKGKPVKIASTGLAMDYSRYIYYLDGDGDVARKDRALGGGGRKPKSSKPSAPTRSTTSSRSAASSTTTERKEHEMMWTGKRGKKSDAQLDAEIEECLAQARTRREGNGSRPAGNGNGSRSVPSASKRGARKTKRR